VRHAECSRCGRCAAVCPDKALEAVGDWIGLDELLYRVAVDRPFFKSSGGGVTLSGGEATLQMAFAQRFLQGLQRRGIHTALETCGFFNYARFCKQLLPHLDAIYFDLKLIDDVASRRYTGRSNRPVLANFSRLVAAAEIPVMVRIPLIPRITATRENLAGLARFLRDHGVTSATLLPYNPLWQDKLKRLGLAGGYGRRSFMTEEEQAACIGRFQASERKPERLHDASLP
jgi:pyruvate formate lyase activating enzyme